MLPTRVRCSFPTIGKQPVRADPIVLKSLVFGMLWAARRLTAMPS